MQTIDREHSTTPATPRGPTHYVGAALCAAFFEFARSKLSGSLTLKTRELPFKGDVLTACQACFMVHANSQSTVRKAELAPVSFKSGDQASRCFICRTKKRDTLRAGGAEQRTAAGQAVPTRAGAVRGHTGAGRRVLGRWWVDGPGVNRFFCAPVYCVQLSRTTLCKKTKETACKPFESKTGQSTGRSGRGGARRGDEAERGWVGRNLARRQRSLGPSSESRKSSIN